MSDYPSFTAIAVPNIPMIQAGDNLPQIILKACADANITLQADDVLVISSKILSKSEGQIVNLADVIPDAEAIELAQSVDKDPRLVQVILQESHGISRKAKGVLVTEHRLGFVSANSAIDQSNIGVLDAVLLLPKDPDESARRIRHALYHATGQDVAIVISDTHGRPFRMGNVGMAIGVAGMQALDDKRGEHDLFGRELLATVQGYADMVASAAHLLCGEGSEGRPVIILRGLDFPVGDGRATDLNRPLEKDLYR
ncbi:MAG: coenzyme F420-0:L-glutamate ligase [Anaerolineae bacterium]|nr:coenzyme F420-0:L-glutamate ligase [Anaerolineae bacterium]MDQ7034172.1 coenzyme F420-0:L-glutamate ligase [Anaerolineae bacterium]